MIWTMTIIQGNRWFLGHAHVKISWIQHQIDQKDPLFPLPPSAYGISSNYDKESSPSPSSTKRTEYTNGCYVGDEGLAAVGACCSGLKDLNLRFCEGLTDKGLVLLALGSGRTLKSLGVAACARITDVALEAVGSNCKSLETLSLDSESIHDRGLVVVAKGCPVLKVLKLQCINLTDEALQAVGSFCLSLELLALYSFQKFTDRSLYAIGKGCKRLQNLTLSDGYFLGNKGLHFVAVGCPELVHIEVNGCHIIGTNGLKSIGKFCKCEAFSTYPRTYDLLHAWTVFSDTERRGCSGEDLLLEMDRIRRPTGFVIIHDKQPVIEFVKKYLAALHWETVAAPDSTSEPGQEGEETVLVIQKKQWLTSE